MTTQTHQVFVGIGPAKPDLDAAIARALKLAAIPSTHRMPGTGPVLLNVRRWKRDAYRQLQRFRAKVKALGPQAGSARLELLKAESYWREMVLLEKQAIREAQLDKEGKLA